MAVKLSLIHIYPQGSLTISLGNPQPDKLPFTLSDAMGRILMDEPLRPGEGVLHLSLIHIFSAAVGFSCWMMVGS